VRWWYPPPANDLRAFLPGFSRSTSAKARSGRPSSLCSYKRPELPQQVLCVLLLLPLPLAFEIHVAGPPDPRPDLTLPRLPLLHLHNMYYRQSREGSYQHSMQHDVAAAVMTEPSRCTAPTSASTGCYHEELSLPSDEEEEQLPPYDCVTNQEFDANAHEMQGRKFTKDPSTSPTHGWWSSTSECLIDAAYHDFILFPSDSERFSDNESTVVSCFSDDLSHSSGSTGSFSPVFRTQTSTTSRQLSGCLTWGPQFLDARQQQTTSSDSVADWLCKVDLDVDCARMEETRLRELMIEADVDRKQDDKSRCTPESAA
jgi:hypothetical protein